MKRETMLLFFPSTNVKVSLYCFYSFSFHWPWLSNEVDAFNLVGDPGSPTLFGLFCKGMIVMNGLLCLPCLIINTTLYSVRIWILLNAKNVIFSRLIFWLAHRFSAVFRPFWTCSAVQGLCLQKCHLQKQTKPREAPCPSNLDLEICSLW